MNAVEQTLLGLTTILILAGTLTVFIMRYVGTYHRGKGRSGKDRRGDSGES